MSDPPSVIRLRRELPEARTVPGPRRSSEAFSFLRHAYCPILDDEKNRHPALPPDAVAAAFVLMYNSDVFKRCQKREYAAVKDGRHPDAGIGNVPIIKEDSYD